MQKALRETQTLRAGCSKAEPKIFAAPQTAFPGPQEGQNLISWRWSLPLHTNPVWWGSMQAISSYRVTDPKTHKHTNKQTNKQIHRQNRLQYTALLSLARSVIINKVSFYDHRASVKIIWTSWSLYRHGSWINCDCHTLRERILYRYTPRNCWRVLGNRVSIKPRRGYCWWKNQGQRCYVMLTQPSPYFSTPFLQPLPSPIIFTTASAPIVVVFTLSGPSSSSVRAANCHR